MGRPDRYLEVYGEPIQFDLHRSGLCPAEQLYGEHSEEVKLLKRFRDTVLMHMPEGKSLIRLYYRLSPDVAAAVRNNAGVRFSMKTLLDELLPMVRLVTD